MKEILGAPAAMVIVPTALTTSASSVSNTIDIRSAWPTNVGKAAHVSIEVLRNANANTNAGSATYVLSHGTTTDATNQTTLATITEGKSTATTGTVSRFEVDTLITQPILKLTITQGTNGTNDNITVSASALGFRTEDTPNLSSGLASGSVVVLVANTTYTN